MDCNTQLLDIVMSPIKEYLYDDGIQEIMVNHTGNVIVEKQNKLLSTELFLTADQIETFIRVVASENGIYVSKSNPSFSSKIEGINCRFQALLPPATSTPIFCIRKHQRYTNSLNYLVEKNMLSCAQAAILKQNIVNKKNILIAGSTGSGKTTLANAILQEIIHIGERIIVIEDTPELQISENNNVRLLVGGHYSYTNAIFDVLRMRPDRIILGELRDGSALDLLKAWNTGHGGGISTIHANSAELALTRLVQLVEEVSVKAPKCFISEVIDICVFVSRIGTSRKVECICKVNEYDTYQNKFITEVCA